MEESRKKFLDSKSLELAIQQDVLPALVRISTENGRVGTGFFQYPHIFISNAHVFPCRELLDITEIIEPSKDGLPLDVADSFLRPSNRDDSPDLVIAEVKPHSRHSESSSASLSKYPFSATPCYPGSHLFYIDLYADGGYQIKRLNLLSKPNTYPLIYQCHDSSVPQLGNSGSPIIKAELMFTRPMKWKFSVESVLYARCNASWYNQNLEVRTVPVPDNTQLICAIPPQSDLLRILPIKHDRLTAERYQQMATFSTIFSDEQGRKATQEYSRRSEAKRGEAEAGLHRFDSGETDLNIALPDGLEKLWYQGIVDITDSLLIKKIRTRELGKKKENFIEESVSIQELAADLEKLLQIIADTDSIGLQKADNVLKTNYFRLDIGISTEGKEKKWILQIQDNTGKHRTADHKSLSSIFAVAKLPGNLQTIKGSELVELLKLSRRDKKEKFLTDLPVRTVARPSFPQKPDKQRKGKAWKPPTFEEQDEEMEESKAAPSTTFVETITRPSIKSPSFTSSVNDTILNTASSPVANTLTVATSAAHISSPETSVSRHMNGVVTSLSLSEDPLSTHDYTPQDIAYLINVNLGTEWTRTNIGDPELGNPIYYTLFRRNDPTHQQIIFPPVTRLQDRDLIESLKDMWTRAQPHLEGAQEVIIPFNPGHHWVLLRITLEENKIVYLDSFDYEGDVDLENMASSLIEGFREYLGGTQSFDTARLQLDEHSCGVVVVDNILDIVNGQELPKRFFSPEDILERRKEHQRMLHVCGLSLEIHRATTSSKSLADAKIPETAKRSDASPAEIVLSDDKVNSLPKEAKIAPVPAIAPIQKVELKEKKRGFRNEDGWFKKILFYNQDSLEPVGFSIRYECGFYVENVKEAIEITRNKAFTSTARPAQKSPRFLEGEASPLMKDLLNDGALALIKAILGVSSDELNIEIVLGLEESRKGVGILTIKFYDEKVGNFKRNEFRINIHLHKGRWSLKNDLFVGRDKAETEIYALTKYLVEARRERAIKMSAVSAYSFDPSEVEIDNAALEQLKKLHKRHAKSEEKEINNTNNEKIIPPTSTSAESAKIDNELLPRGMPLLKSVSQAQPFNKQDVTVERLISESDSPETTTAHLQTSQEIFSPHQVKKTASETKEVSPQGFFKSLQQQARQDLANKKYQDAIKKYSQLIEIYKQNPNVSNHNRAIAHYGIGYSNLGLGNLTAAHHNLQEAVKLDQSSPLYDKKLKECESVMREESSKLEKGRTTEATAYC